MRIKHDVDFYSVYLRQKSDTHKSARSRYAKLPFFLLGGIILVGAAYGLIERQNILLAAQEKELMAYLNGSDVALQSASATSLDEQYQQVHTYNNLVQTAHDSIALRSLFTRDAYTMPVRAIEKNGGTLLGITMDGEKLYYYVSFKKPSQAADAADAVEATGVYHSVWYEGWANITNTESTVTQASPTATPTVVTTTTQGNYVIFTCILKGATE